MKILVYIPTIRAVSGLHDEDFRILENKYYIDYLLGYDNINFVRGRSIFKLGVLDSFTWLTYYIVFYEKFLVFLKVFDPAWRASNHLYKGVSTNAKRIIQFLDYARILRPAAFLADYLFNKSIRLCRDLRKQNYDLVIAFTGIKDPGYHSLASWAKSQSNPILAIPTNWDNLSSKPFTVRPDYIAVWGEQATYFAKLCQGIDYRNVFVLGNPKFDKRHYSNDSEVKEYLDSIGLREEKFILFAGAGEQIDENLVLEKLSVLVDNELNSEILIVYKMHPARKLRGEKFSVGNLPNLVIIEPEFGRDGVENIYLLKSCLAVVSAYSTMTLQALFFGKLSFSFYYNTADNRLHNWQVYGNHVNLFPLKLSNANSECSTIATLDEELIKFLGKLQLKSEALKSNAKITAERCVARFENNYVERLIETINIINDLQFNEKN